MEAKLEMALKKEKYTIPIQSQQQNNGQDNGQGNRQDCEQEEPIYMRRSNLNNPVWR